MVVVDGFEVVVVVVASIGGACKVVFDNVVWPICADVESVVAVAAIAVAIEVVAVAVGGIEVVVVGLDCEAKEEKDVVGVVAVVGVVVVDNGPVCWFGVSCVGVLDAAEFPSSSTMGKNADWHWQ